MQSRTTLIILLNAATAEEIRTPIRWPAHGSLMKQVSLSKPVSDASHMTNK